MLGLERERKAMTRLWAKRKVQIRSMVEATAGRLIPQISTTRIPNCIKSESEPFFHAD